MLIRIVKMQFKKENIAAFQNLFDSHKQLIRGFEGCERLELLQEINNETIFFTYSYWQSEAFLEKYRQSELFGQVWSQTKILFDSKPQAWSVRRLVLLQ